MALLEYRKGTIGEWYPLPTPAPENYYTTKTHEEKSYLDSKGYLHRDIIRRNRAKVFCGWNALSGEEVALLDSLYDLDYFYLRYTDNSNKRVVSKVYAGPLNNKALIMNPKTFEITLRTNNTMNFIEY